MDVTDKASAEMKLEAIKLISAGDCICVVVPVVDPDAENYRTPVGFAAMKAAGWQDQIIALAMMQTVLGQIATTMVAALARAHKIPENQLKAVLYHTAIDLAQMRGGTCDARVWDVKPNQQTE